MADKIVREKLMSGGELVISGNNCRIEYFFPGPDKRYGGVHVNISGEKVYAYACAWKNNFDRYMELVLAGDRPLVVERGEMGMVIRCGFMSGVYLSGNHMRIVDKEQLRQILEDYEYVQKKYKELVR